MSDDETGNTIPPLKKSEEIALAVSRGLLAELPGGGLLLELLPYIVPDRIKRFFGSTESDLIKLLESGKLTREDLVQNENFFSVLMTATMIAVRTHQEEKLELLRNVVLNSALPNAPEDDIQALYLSYIDRLTVWHVRILKLFDTPHEPEITQDNLPSLLEKKFPLLVGKKEFYIPIVNELYFLTLTVGDLSPIVTSDGDYISSADTEVFTTNLGRSFLKYLASPLNATSQSHP